MTQVTHSFQSEGVVAGKKISLSFYVMNGRSSPVVVLCYSFMYEHDANINFGSREMKLGGPEVACLPNEVTTQSTKQSVYARINRLVYPRESAMVSLGTAEAIGGGMRVVPARLSA